MRIKIIILFLFSSIVFAEDLSRSFPMGAGSRFTMKLEGIDTQIMIYVSESSPDRVGIETYFSSEILGKIELWQQSIFRREKKDQIQLAENFIYTKDLKAPEKFDHSIIQKEGEFEIRDFIFSDAKSLQANLIGTEEVSTAAGKVRAMHYKQSKKGHTIEYWISDEAKPIGLVKLVVKGKRSFDLELAALVKNVKRRIDPKRAIPLTSQGRTLLSIRENNLLP